MTIQEWVRRDYLDAVRMTEAMAERFPERSQERARWLHVAAIYRQVTQDLMAEQGQAVNARPVALSPGPQPS